MPIELISAAVLLLGLGAIAGFLAGLLGIGGGAILVPGLYYLFNHFGYHDKAMHIAIGTSLLTIIFTGTSSAYAHYKKGAIDPILLKNFIPGIFIGVIIGTLLAKNFSSSSMKMIFASSQLLFGSYMLLKREKMAFFENMPKQPWFTLVSATNSCLATLMGVGGGVPNIAFMTLCNVVIHKAIATAAAIGPFIAIIGATGFLIIGLSDKHLPPFSLGYLNIPAFFCITAISVFIAPFGAKIAHQLSVKKLKQYFAIFMLVVAAKMLYA